MKRQHYYLLFALSILGASCDNTVYEDINSQAEINAQIGDYQTRAHATSWDDNDAIGIFASNELQDYQNSAYQYSDAGSGFQNQRKPIYFKYNNLDLAFTGYFPYTADEKINNDTVSINTAHQADHNLNLMFASSVNASNIAPAVNLNFTHKMAKVVLNFSPTEGITYDQLTDASTQLFVSGLKHQASFNVRTGELSLHQSALPVTNQLVDVDALKQNPKMTYVLYYVPQVVSLLQIKLLANHKELSLILPVPENSHHKSELEEGKSYNYDISVNTSLIQIEDLAVTNWVTPIGDWHEENLRSEYIL